jgi:hypothetical protein
LEQANWDRYVFISDGERYYPLVKIIVRGTDVYVVDPNAPDSGKISYHVTGAFNLGQPNYEPQVVHGRLGPLEGIHGYQYVTRQSFNSHGFARLLQTTTSTGPSIRRPGPVVDIREQPPGTRFLEVEIGVRCPAACHVAADAIFPSLRFFREETPISTRLLVVSASWHPLFTLGPSSP